ncbi:hypothetical protein [uncultured Zobellia sp.]|uniref:hypothetical protein n=1 Tax=uncultured Zobellia sp. TaxID=255433 RepID=UPI00259798D9|nr:hypothetical protein [uncultured Zobellia sp.]
MKKEYINFDITKGYPAGKDIYYECGKCNDEIFSMPENFSECKCGNLILDMTMARLTVLDGTSLRILKKNK